MKKFIDIKTIFIFLLLILIVLLILNPRNFLSRKQNVVEKIMVDSIPYPVHDTIPYEVEVEVEVEVPVEVEVRVEVPVVQQVDTAAILKDFYIKNQQKETLLLPNNLGKIFLDQTITQNKVVSTEFKAEIKPTIKNDTILIPEPKKNQLYFGLESGLSRQDHISNIGVGLLFKTKEDKIFKVTGGVANRLQTNVTGVFYPYLEGGVYWRLKNKKRN
jgi:hypothetical protein